MPEDNKPEIRQTEFDSSVATLQRIDNIIQNIHSCSISDIYEHDFRIRKRNYLDLIDRLFVEGQCKFTNEEMEKSEEFQKELANIHKKYNSVLHFAPATVQGCWDSWSILLKKAREFELYLMRCLDRHNMLLRDSKDAMTKFRTG